MTHQASSSFPGLGRQILFLPRDCLWLACPSFPAHPALELPRSSTLFPLKQELPTRFQTRVVMFDPSVEKHFPSLKGQRPLDVPDPTSARQ